MTTKHTKGPYSTSGITGDNHIMAAHPALGRVTVAIATGHPGISDEEFAANKALLSAAPDLLAALESCVERMAELQKHTNYPLAWPRVQAMQAIAKAKGEL